MRAAVISDTHGLLRPEILEIIKGCDVILHAGDIDGQGVIDQLKAIAPAYFVRGNADKEWASELPRELDITLSGFRIYMVHNKKHIRPDLQGIDFVIYGHSHKYEMVEKDGCTYLNPGSCGPRRFHLAVTMMVLTLHPEAHRFEVEMMDCSPQVKSGKEMQALPGKDMHRLISEMTKAVDAGTSVKEIAVKCRVKEELAEQICRIYLTHPGVDVEGILTRLEIKDL